MPKMHAMNRRRFSEPRRATGPRLFDPFEAAADLPRPHHAVPIYAANLNPFSTRQHGDGRADIWSRIGEGAPRTRSSSGGTLSSRILPYLKRSCRIFIASFLPAGREKRTRSARGHLPLWTSRAGAELPVHELLWGSAGTTAMLPTAAPRSASPAVDWRAGAATRSGLRAFRMVRRRADRRRVRPLTAIRRIARCKPARGRGSRQLCIDLHRASTSTPRSRLQV